MLEGKIVSLAPDETIVAFANALADAARPVAMRYFRAAPEVQQCYYVTGGISLVLVIVVPDMAAYEASTRRLFAQNESVKSFRSLIALDRVKAGMEIEIPATTSPAPRR